MKTIKVFLVLTLFCAVNSGTILDMADMKPLQKRVLEKVEWFDGRWPEYTVEGTWQYREKVNWFSGFLAGELWAFYAISGDEELRDAALELSDNLLEYAGIDYTHDMGFIFLPSVVRAYQETGEAKYRDAGLQAANMLMRRFNPAGEFIRAWGKLGSESKAGWMIIDTMMNLELLFWAWQETGDYAYYDVAYRHALTTLDVLVRDNFSSFHVAEFDPQSGELLKQFTHQGLADETTWARGQAWGIYGFANAFRHTGYKPFLNASRKMAKYFLTNLPQDNVPYWDLSLSGDDVPRDASAAAIAASGLLLLADVESERNAVLSAREKAVALIQSLIKNYTYISSSRDTEQDLLIHTVYNYHKDWGVDESFPAGDYYLSECIEKLWRLEQPDIPAETPAKRRLININRDWFYLQDNAPDLSGMRKAAAPWQKIDLPHTWNTTDVMDSEPGYRRDAGWYEKRLTIEELSSAERCFLYFEGANITTDFFVNGQKAGGHVGGYVGFEIDVTPYLKAGENIIHVRVDNSVDRNIIPSQKSDFFIYGGITRDVWLKMVPESHIRRIEIRTPQVSADQARVEAEVIVSSEDKTLSLKASIVDAAGKEVARAKAKVTAGKALLSFPEIAKPLLWSPDTPHLYTMIVELESGNGTDRVEERFGLRWFEFEENGPFYLNGKRLLLRGTHRHEEHAFYGAAMPDSLHRRDMEMIKEMGANFVRLGHYPQDLEVYKTCDELGLLVWDELPWCRGGMGEEVWQDNTKRLLKEQILQNFNHPSIIMWSLGNEMYWLPDFEGGDDDTRMRAFLSELNDIAHKLDPSRKTAIRKYYEGADIVDVFSPSIWAGWYSGVYTNYERALEDARSKYPRFIHAEYGGSSHVGRHVTNPITGEGVLNPNEWEEAVNQVKVNNIAREGDWSESYIVDLFDWHLSVSEKLEWFTGNAQWAFKDFGTPLRPENAIPYLNQKGLVDREGNPKDAYYVFKSYWGDDPFVYIESPTWTERLAGVNANLVDVFSNCGGVELLLNGKSLGEKERIYGQFPAHGLQWEVPFVNGANRLVALGKKSGSVVHSDTVDVNYYEEPFGKAAEIALKIHKLENGRYQIEALAVDKNGRRCLDYNQRIYFSAYGPGELLKHSGLPFGSDIIEMANGRAVIEFIPVPGKAATIEARNQDFKGSYLRIND